MATSQKRKRSGTDLNYDSTQPKRRKIYVGDPGLYGVERIINRRTRKRKVEYLLKWEGYSDSENSWEDKADVTPDLVESFENERKSTSAGREPKKQKINHEVSSGEFNGTFEVPPESTLKDAPQEVRMHEPNEVIMELNDLSKSSEGPVKVQVPQQKKGCYEVPDDKHNISSQVLNESPINSPEKEQNELLNLCREVSEWSKRTEGPEKIQPLKKLCKETLDNALESLLSAENETPRGCPEEQQDEWPMVAIEPEKQKVVDEISNVVLNTSGMQMLSDSLIDSSDKKRNELLLATKEKVQGRECFEIPNDNLTEAPPTQVLMELPVDKQKELLNRMPSKQYANVKTKSLKKKSSPSKILVTESSTTKVKVLKTSTRKMSTITRKKKLMQSEYVSGEEDEKDLLGYDGCQPYYA